MWPIMEKNIHVDYLFIPKRKIPTEDAVMNVTLKILNVI